jgi:hypothetical protein
MARLRDFPWFPTAWVAESGHAATAAEISRDGVLNNVRLLDKNLSLVVDHKGVICTATVMLDLPEDALILLRRMLLQYCGQPMNVVEEVDIVFSGPFPVIR